MTKEQEAGYTVLETLIALSILLLASAGVLAGAHILSVRQEKIVHLSAQSAEAGRLERTLQDFALRLSASGTDLNTLMGSSRQLDAPCGSGPCTMSIIGTASKHTLVADMGPTHMQLPLHSGASFEFGYLDEVALRDHWPIVADKDVAPPRLKGLALVQDGRVIAFSTVPSALRPDCVYDDVGRICKAPVPHPAQ